MVEKEIAMTFSKYVFFLEWKRKWALNDYYSFR